MAIDKVSIATEQDLLKSLKISKNIVITKNLTFNQSILIPPKVKISGATGKETICFRKANSGLLFTKNNEITNLQIEGFSPQSKVIRFHNSHQVEGTYLLKNIIVLRGCIILISRKINGRLRLTINQVVIKEADATQFKERPFGYNVRVLQGALTIWNKDRKNIPIIVVKKVALGQKNKPIYGSGIMVAGTKHAQLKVDLLTTDEIHNDGKIPVGIANLITGAVFVITNAHVKEIINHQVITTYGYNDMVLDNWGVVDSWKAFQKISSQGRSAIGFVNFGYIKNLALEGPIETFGEGSRGINNYDGTIDKLSLAKITTHGDGAIGFQISKPIGDVIIKGNLETYGGLGKSLVKGVIQELKATALSIKPGGSIKSFRIEGKMIVHNQQIPTLEVLGAKPKKQQATKLKPL
ncbi:hypothetical protein JN01_0088 [Entomoplasma freundtii]|uniref:Uncharacterized protein n=1 Tax=Entomoplasma freundtii TaxID=74700 RepID=A0A2K8NS75_9MOLU|nr:hypothetical protein [Entomoplasma freundtii]ATZ16690.1 hypothetical protein EFREU_v1c06700 [Entomoplasma freundtii]TDY58143.1 hypothetical protein JN01_0088 [Entomoplasma freundtii]